MTMRKGLGKGKGSGYYNLPITYAHDRRTHHLAGKGIKSVQPMPQLLKGTKVKSKFTGAKGSVVSKEPFAVKYQSNGKTFVRFSNPKYWVKGGKGMVMVKFDKNSYTMIPQKHLKDFQAQYGGRVCKGGKFSDDAKQFLQKEWQQVKELSKEVGSGVKRAYEYEKEHLPEQAKAVKEALSPKNISKKIAEKAEGVAQYVQDVEESGARTKSALKSIFGKKDEKKENIKKEMKIAEAKLIRPEVRKLDKQIKRVSELKRQIADKELMEHDSSHLVGELEREESELRDLQEEATKINVEELSNAELRLLAIRHKENDGFFNVLFGTDNEYEHELIRRIKKEKTIDKEIYEAKHPQPSRAKSILAEIF
jgi:hypothetical protein